MAGKRFPTSHQVALTDLLRAVRTDSGLSQVQLAAKLKQPQSYVSKYESGERRLDVLELRQVCAATGVSLAAFAERLEKSLSAR